MGKLNKNNVQKGSKPNKSTQKSFKNTCVRGMFLQPLTVFLWQIYSAVELYSNARRKKNKRMSPSLAATTHKKFCLIFPSADRFCIFTQQQPTSVMMMELEFSTAVKAINFCAIHLIKEEKKRMGNYFSYYREKWEGGARVENMAASST